jgi:hypothetical protein
VKRKLAFEHFTKPAIIRTYEPAFDGTRKNRIAGYEWAIDNRSAVQTGLTASWKKVSDSHDAQKQSR